MGAKENMKLMMTLDDAWNNQDWETFKKRHGANVAVYWPDLKFLMLGLINLGGTFMRNEKWEIRG
jgi:hypothetical protein